MNRTKGSWIINTAEKWELRLSTHLNGSIYNKVLPCKSQQHASSFYMKALEAKHKGVDAGYKFFEEYAGDLPYDWTPWAIYEVDGVYRIRTMTEKFCVRDGSYEEQSPYPIRR